MRLRAEAWSACAVGSAPRTAHQPPAERERKREGARHAVVLRDPDEGSVRGFLFGHAWPRLPHGRVGPGARARVRRRGPPGARHRADRRRVGVDPGAVHLDADAIIEDYNGHLLATTWRLLHAAPRLRAPPVLGLRATAVAFISPSPRWSSSSLAGASARAGAPARGGGGVSRHRRSDAFPERAEPGSGRRDRRVPRGARHLDRGTPRADLAACAPALGSPPSPSRSRSRPAPASRSFGGTTACGASGSLVPTVAYGVWRLVYGGSLSGDVRAGSSGSGTLDVVGNARGGNRRRGGCRRRPACKPRGVTDRLPWLDSLAQVVVGLGEVALLGFLLDGGRSARGCRTCW